MTVATAGPSAGANRLSGLWNRQLDTYPGTGRRVLYLAITVVSTIVLYYQLYELGAVSTLLLQNLHMSFTFLVYMSAFGALIGAFGSLFAGLADRLGRTNLVVAGLLIIGLLVAFLIPAATSKWQFTIEYFLVNVVEGICLVATPALIRDFSPQVGRGTAMGFWTSGPVLGSLIVAIVASATIPTNVGAHFWTHEYRIAGITGLVVFAITLFWLKELSPGLRDQLMVTMSDRALIEARAKGIDIEASLRHPWRQLVKPAIVIPALGVSIFLITYYTAVAFGVIYFVTLFGYTVNTANHLGDWTWAAQVVAVVVFGIVSDRLRVRKPFMIVGGVATAVMVVIYLQQAGRHPTFAHLALVVSLLSFFLGVAYVPWMASFTETVEAHNPALTATGLSIWGWIVRIVVFAAYMIVPSVVHSVTPLVDDAPALQAKYPALTLPSSVLTTLAKDPTNAAALHRAEQLLGPKAIPELLAVKSMPSADAATFAKVQKAAADNPGQWKNWYWICFGGTILFLGTVPFMKGRWSPEKAREDEAAHEAMVRAEMAELGLAAT